MRRRSDRKATPSAAIIDSQTARTTARGGLRGYDGGKKIGGRNRHLFVDVAGLVVGAEEAVTVTAADAGAVRVGVNGEDPEALGASGEQVTRTFTPES